MEELPIPLSRVELYLAKAAGMDVTIPEKPLSRLEQFLAVIAGDTNVEMPIPYSFSEQWLSCVYYGASFVHPPIEGAYRTDNQKVDARYFAVASGVPGATLPPAPQNRKEQYWAVIAQNGPIHGVYKYVTGTNFDLIDVMSDIQELKFVYGDTYQTTYAGKNLLNMPITDGSGSGLTWVKNADGSITITGTASEGIHIYGNYTMPQAWLGKTLTLSTDKVDTGVNMGFKNSSGGGNHFILTYGVASNTQKITQDNIDITARFEFYVKPGTVLNDFTVHVMLEYGSTISAYEPYTGGIPSPNPDYPQNVEYVTGAQTMSIAGENLFNKNNPYQFVGYFDNSADNPVLIATGGNRNRVIYVPCRPNTVYSISLASRSGVNSPQVGTIDSFPVDGLPVTNLGSFASGALKFENKTTPASAKFIVIRFQTSSAGTIIGDILPGVIEGLQIEEGATATEYQAFQGQKYIFTLDGNLFNNRDFNDIPNGYDASGKITLGTGNANDLFWIPCKPNTAYSFKFPVSDANPPLDYKKVFTTEAEPAVGVTILNSSATIAKDTETYENFVTDSNAHYLCVRVRGNNFFDVGNGYDMSLASLKIVEGATLTPADPIELNKLGTYQDYIYKNGNDWYLHKATASHVLQNLVSGDNPTVRRLSRPDGSTYFQCRVNGDSAINGNWHSSSNNAAIKSAKSTHFVVGSAWGETTVHFWVDATNLIMFTPGSIDNTQTTTQFIEWVNTNKPKFYHVLATPTDTKITDTTLIAQLDAIASATLPRQEAHIRITAADSNLPAPIEIGYLGRGD